MNLENVPTCDFHKFRSYAVDRLQWPVSLRFKKRKKKKKFLVNYVSWTW